MSLLSPDTGLLSVVGASALLFAAYKTLDFVWLYLQPSRLYKYLRATSGNPAWAIVTGASDGIGKAIAFELASQGFNVVLHGRNPTKLDGVKAALSKAHPARSFRIWFADATKCHSDSAWLEKAVRSFDDINLTVLVNNVGGGSNPAFGGLDQFPPQEILDNLHLNVTFPTLLTSALIPLLVKNSPSLIINIGSIADHGLPLVSVYGASKAFGDILSQAVWREMMLEGREIEVIVHRLGPVTETQGNSSRASLGTPSARTIAKAVLARTGCGKKSVVSYWCHGVQDAALGFIPVSIFDYVVTGVMKRMRAEQETAKTK
ncbi:short chain dehydrogenase [Pseudomassariella vexata]|uniref:Short chain dehydrogenase n=1 Tax=Pseudomassariella vexata TaxID=1141098 RepID=A0A1Y2EBM9_9PEZI|nr:short chain dehydrogenase [Pseudomassariella vexata]ORY68676.1 short chain dehydrogenase [Pseudomassariella vexata]